MAEFVEQKIEYMLGELEQLQRVNLFTPSEVKDIVKRRRDYEYRIQKRHKRITDYQAYIKYEVDLMGLLSIRRKKLGYFFKKDEIERPIRKRISQLHWDIVQRFKSRLDLWMAYVQSLEMLKDDIVLSRVWTQLLQVHPCTDPRLWCSAAHWFLHGKPKIEMKKNKNSLKIRQKRLEWANKLKGKQDIGLSGEELTELSEYLTQEETLINDKAYIQGIVQARRVLIQGISNNPDSKVIYLDLFKVELIHADLLKHREMFGGVDVILEEDLSKIIDGSTALLILDEVLSKWPEDSDLLASLVAETAKFPRLQSLDVTKKAETVYSGLMASRNSQKMSDNSETNAGHIEGPSSVAQNVIPKKNTQTEVEHDLRIQLEECVAQGGPSKGIALWRQWEKQGEKGLTAALFHAYIQLHKTQMEMSRSQGENVSPSVMGLRKEFEKKVAAFGKHSVDFWLDYMTTEEEFGDPLKLADLDWRSRRHLQENLVPQLVYSRMNALATAT